MFLVIAPELPIRMPKIFLFLFVISFISCKNTEIISSNGTVRNSSTTPLGNKNIEPITSNQGTTKTNQIPPYILLSEETTWEINQAISISQYGSAIKSFSMYISAPTETTFNQSSFYLMRTSEINSGVKPRENFISPFNSMTYQFDGYGTGSLSKLGHEITHFIVYQLKTVTIQIEPNSLIDIKISQYDQLTDNLKNYVNLQGPNFQKVGTQIQNVKEKILTRMSSLASAEQTDFTSLVISLVEESFKYFLADDFLISNRMNEVSCLEEQGSVNQVINTKCGTQLDYVLTFNSLLAAFNIPARPVLGIDGAGVISFESGKPLRVWSEVYFDGVGWLPINIIEAILHSTSKIDKSYFIHLPYSFIGISRSAIYDGITGFKSFYKPILGATSAFTENFIPETKFYIMATKL